MEPMDMAEAEAKAHQWRDDLYALRNQLQFRLSEMAETKDQEDVPYKALLAEFENTISEIIDGSFDKTDLFTERLWLKTHTKFKRQSDFKRYLDVNRLAHTLTSIDAYETALTKIQTLPDL